MHVRKKGMIINMTERLICENIRTDVRASGNEALDKARRILKRLGIRDIYELELHRRSLDARRRGNTCFVCSVICTCEMPDNITDSALAASDVKRRPKTVLDFPAGTESLRDRIVIVGFGPAGIFAALTLAEHGFRPLVLERGASVAERVRKVDDFFGGGKLDTRTNVQFGAGGAGTFSDGKLTCRIGDSASETVLDMLVSLGAPRDILYKAKPHIGTDVLRTVVQNAADRLTALGGEIRYLAKAEKITDRTVTVDGETIPYGALILACGHSARDTYRELIASGFSVEAKAYSVGVRVEHLQSDMNDALLGEYADILPPAEYNLSKRSGDRGVYTFCMCPGGVVAASQSEENTVVTNGMSYRLRDGKNANSAVCVSVLPGDFGGSPEGAIDYQRILEEKAFILGGSDYNAPMQTVGDFLAGRSGTEPKRIIPTYRDGKVTPADLHDLFPGYISSMLDLGLRGFGQKIRGFDVPDAILCGVESRTSAPVRILRTDGRTAAGHPDIYPCGEGAGYAGGIVSAAVDGIRTARAIIARFAPEKD